MRPYGLRPGFWRAIEDRRISNHRPRGSVASNARDFRTPRKVERHESKLEAVGLAIEAQLPEPWDYDDFDDDDCPSCGALVYGLSLASIGGCIVGEPHRRSDLVAPLAWVRHERTARRSYGIGATFTIGERLRHDI